MHCKSYLHFFQQKFQNICISLVVNFNESLTNDVVSFEQLGPEYYDVNNRLSSLQVCVYALVLPCFSTAKCFFKVLKYCKRQTMTTLFAALLAGTQNILPIESWIKDVDY